MFKRVDTPTVMSGLVVRYESTNEPYDYEINASREGVSIRGRWPIMSVESTIIVEEYLERARWHHRHLKEWYESHWSGHVVATEEAEIERLITMCISPLPPYEGG